MTKETNVSKVAFITASLYSSNVHDGGKLQELSHMINNCHVINILNFTKHIIKLTEDDKL